MRGCALLAAAVLAASCSTNEPESSTGGERGFRLVRLSPSGPDGRALQGEGGQREHTYFASSESPTASAGVWEADPYTSGPDVFPFSELMILLEGSVTLRDEAGREETFRAGDVVLVPRGVRHHWIQPELLRKYWVVFDEGSEDGGGNETFLRVEPEVTDGAGHFETDVARGRVDLRTDDARVAAGVWEAAPHTVSYEPQDYSELVFVLEGSVVVVDEAGREERLGPGDAAVLPRGMSFVWRQEEPLKKVWVTFDAG